MNINVEFEVILQSSNVDFLETIIVKKSSTTYTMGRIPLRLVASPIRAVVFFSEDSDLSAPPIRYF